MANIKNWEVIKNMILKNQNKIIQGLAKTKSGPGNYIFKRLELSLGFPTFSDLRAYETGKECDVNIIISTLGLIREKNGKWFYSTDSSFGDPIPICQYNQTDLKEELTLMQVKVNDLVNEIIINEFSKSG